MASVTLPTQALPPYLSASTFTVTSDGAVSTGVSTVGVPLTYFGPSIPLGPDDVWTFGGSTSPASSLSSATSTSLAIPTTSSSAATSTSQAVPTTSPTTSPTSSLTQSTIASTSSLSGSQTSVSGSSTSSLPGPSASPTSGHSSALKRAIPGIVIGSLVVALVLALLICLFAVRRRKRTMYENPNMSDFVIVDEEGGTRVAGEGVARPTGEEEDPFLSREGESTGEMTQRNTGTRLVSQRSSGGETIGTIPVPEGVVPAALSTTQADPSPHSTRNRNSPFFHASASSLFFHPSRGPDPSVVVAAGSKRDSASTQQSSGRSEQQMANRSTPQPLQGAIIPRHELLQMQDQWQQEDDGSGAAVVASRNGVSELGERTDDQPGTPLRPPPVLNPDGIRQTSRPDSTQTTQSLSDTPNSDLDERATLLTARRVRMNESGPSTLITPGETSPSTWGSSFGLGLGGLTRLSRLSWFQRMEALRSGSSSGSDADNRTNSPFRRSMAGSALDVPRPVSHLSVGSNRSSGNESTYHDAVSTVSTGSGHGNNAVPPLPTRSGNGQSSTSQSPQGNGSGNVVVSELPTVPEPAQSRVPSPSHAAGTGQADTEDVLDTPVPRPTSQFSSASSRGGGPALPPGLEHLANVRSWRESSSDMPSPASLGTGGTLPLNNNMDVLEEEPPRPREVWTHLRTVQGGTVDMARRTTLGQSIFIDVDDELHHRDHSSEQASLHSMPGRLSPFAAAGSGGSNSHSHSHSRHTPSSMSSGSSRSHSSRLLHETHSGRASASGSQLHHSNSITSVDQRRARHGPGEPFGSANASMQSLSAFGPARLSALGGAGGVRLVGTPQYSPLPDPDATFSTGVTSQASMSNLSGASHNTRTTATMDPQQSDEPVHLLMHWNSPHGIHQDD